MNNILKLSDLIFEDYAGSNFSTKLNTHFYPTPGLLQLHQLFNTNFPFFMKEIRETPRFHGKQWQYFQIMANALRINKRRKKALGFGVGKEPVPAFLARYGFRVTATDYLDGINSSDWFETGQLTRNLQELNSLRICDSDTFKKNVNFASVDMNETLYQYKNKFDFVWSTCALGHIGGYENGLNFIKKSLLCLKRGGIAVHTTEVDLSDQEKFDTPGLSLYKISDINYLIQGLDQSKMYTVLHHNLEPGNSVLEKYVDQPPYSIPHLRIEVLGREVLPFALVIMRN